MKNEVQLTATRSNDIRSYVRSTLSLPRYLHSLRTAETAARLCGRFGRDYGVREADARVAGISHDMAREMEEKDLIGLAGRDVYPVSEEEMEKPTLLHGRAAAVLMSERFGERREHVLKALRWHTFGHPDMGALGMILYVADYIEPGRPHVDEEFFHEVMEKDTLEEMVLTIMTEEFEHLRRKGRRIVQFSRMLYDALMTEEARSGV